MAQNNFGWIGKSPDGETVLLHKFTGKFKAAEYATNEWLSKNAELVKTGVVIDVETTGLNRKSDLVIEIGLRRFQFNRANGDVLTVGTSYSGLQDPGRPLSDEIKRLTGLTDEALQGKNIDWGKVDQMLSDANIILAHNASFDRPFIDRHCPSSVSKPWGCSVKQVDWPSKGYGTAKLEILSIYHGFFVDAHRALNDVDALLHLLSHTDRLTHKCYLNELLANARRPLVRIVASNSPFESKDFLKERGYSWDTAGRAWHKMVFKDRLSDEIAWMETTVYNGSFRGSAEEISLLDNFKL